MFLVHPVLPRLTVRAALGLGLWLSFYAVGHSETVDAPGRWIGRVDESARLFDWPGSGVALAIEGSRLSIRLDDRGENSLDIVADGATRRLDLRPGVHDYELWSGPKGHHEIRLVKRTEGDVGTVTFLSAKTDGRFRAPSAPQRRILVIGDSISTGYGIEGRGPECNATPDVQNHRLTYAGLAASAWDAEATVLAASGRGLVRNFDGSTEGTMPDLLDRAAQSSPEPSRPAPGPFDLVLVHLGTNDYAKDATPPGFRDAYRAGLETLRQRYPATPIYALIGPMLSPDRLETAQTAIRDAVEARQSAGDRQVHFLAFPAPPLSYGCAWHPGLEAQRAMADQLIARVKTDLGW